ncbi:MAG: undecaprenyl-diphosphate phosphatase [Desulfamplus sp.]|nr:undecaprenyl-diphosphate phosphatase [Desulfamplus sp.]
METYQAIVLGILQGLTEFLPVSSSGHLALAQYSFGIDEPTLFFDVSLHMGTLLAVAVVFFKDIRDIVMAVIRFMANMIMPHTLKGRNGASTENLQHGERIPGMIGDDIHLRVALLIIAGSIPTAIMGLFFKQYVDFLSGSINFVGCMMLVTGTFLWLTRGVEPSGTGIRGLAAKNADSSAVNHPDHVPGSGMGMKQALIIGTCQGMAVLPGISRSGATISAAIFLGINREAAARFSFLLSMPAILGAELLAFRDFLSQGIVFDISILYGTFISFVVGYLALIFLITLVKNGKFYLFAPYCWIVGGVSILAGVW